MQACQRRTIGGGGGGSGGGGGGDRGWLAQLRLHPPPLVSLFLLFAVPHYPTIQPILFGWDSSHSLYAVIARPGGDIGVRMDRHEGVRYCLLVPFSFSLYFSICFSSSPSRIYFYRLRASRLFLPFPFHRFYLLIAHLPLPPILPSDYG